MAPSPAAITAAQPLATPGRWSDVGADDRVIWGSFQGSGAEPYDTVVYMADEEFIAEGAAEAEVLLDKYLDAVENDYWPGYGQDCVLPLSLPVWAKAEETLLTADFGEL